MWSKSKWTPHQLSIASEDFSAWLTDVKEVMAHAQVRQGSLNASNAFCCMLRADRRNVRTSQGHCCLLQGS